MSVSNCAKSKQRPRAGQSSILEALRGFNGIRRIYTETLEFLIQNSKGDSFTRISSRMIAEHFGIKRNAVQNRLRQLEKLGLIERKTEQLTYTHRQRRIKILYRSIRILIGLPVTFGDRRKAKKRYISTHFVRRKEKLLKKLRLEQERFAFEGIKQATMSLIIKNLRKWRSSNQLNHERIQFTLGHMRQHGATKEQINTIKTEVLILTEGYGIGLIPT